MYIVTATVFATWFGSETVLGIPATFMKEGFSGIIADPFGSSLCLILVGLFFARPLYRMNLRLDATREWIWAIRDFDDRQLNAAAEIARRYEIYDRAINTADRTVGVHDFNLRYLAPYRDVLKVHTAELALDEKGKFLGLRGSVLCNAGGHSVMYVPLVKCSELLTSVYRVPAAYVRARATLSNTPPTNPYRSAGRPEAMFVMERLCDLAARQCGFDRIGLRKRNLIPPSAQPYPNPLGMTYDCGEFEKSMVEAVKLADVAGFPKRREEARRRGRLRGLAVVNAIERAASPAPEFAEVRFNPSGTATIFMGTKNQGQGHETTFKQILHERLGIAPEDVRLT